VFFRFSERLSVEWTWRARGVKPVRKIVTRQRSCAESTGRINVQSKIILTTDYQFLFGFCKNIIYK